MVGQRKRGDAVGGGTCDKRLRRKQSIGHGGMAMKIEIQTFFLKIQTIIALFLPHVRRCGHYPPTCRCKLIHSVGLDDR